MTLLQLCIPQACTPACPSPPLTQAGGKSEKRRNKRGAGVPPTPPVWLRCWGTSRQGQPGLDRPASTHPQGLPPVPRAVTPSTDSPHTQGSEHTSVPPSRHPLPLSLHLKASTEPQGQRGTPGCPHTPRHPQAPPPPPPDLRNHPNAPIRGVPPAHPFGRSAPSHPVHAPLPLPTPRQAHPPQAYPGSPPSPAPPISPQMAAGPYPVGCVCPPPAPRVPHVPAPQGPATAPAPLPQHLPPRRAPPGPSPCTVAPARSIFASARPPAHPPPPPPPPTAAPRSLATAFFKFTNGERESAGSARGGRARRAVIG